MDRRRFTRLLALAPLAFTFKPSEPECTNLYCATCGKHVAALLPAFRIEREGRTLCAEHSGCTNWKGEPEGLIENYHFAPRDWHEYRQSYAASIGSIT